MDGRPLKTKKPYVKLLWIRSQSGCPSEEAVTCTVPLSPVSSQPEPGCETAEDTLEDSDVVITGVQPGQPLPASLTSRMADVRAMVLQPDTWLDDCAIDHAQALLKAKYPHVGGLYATTSDCGLFAIAISAEFCEVSTTDGLYGKMKTQLFIVEDL
ncbi:hypothetical protein JZ751_014043, partial [Albula glossodonta]